MKSSTTCALSNPLEAKRASIVLLAGQHGKIIGSSRDIFSAAPVARQGDRLIAAMVCEATLGGIAAVSQTLPKSLQLACAFIESQLREDIGTDDLCRVSGIPSSGLNAVFSKYLGYAPQKYIRVRRLEEARRVLTQNQDATIAQIATECGFNHLDRFAGFYREQFGQTPSEARRDLFSFQSFRP